MDCKSNYFDSLVNSGEESEQDCFEHFHSCDDHEILNFPDFVKLCGELFVRSDGERYEVEPSDLQEIFTSFDLNADSKLDRNEFKNLWNELIWPMLNPKSAILVIDVQNDFIDGSLALRNCPAQQDGAQVVQVINNLLKDVNFTKVFYSLDWHPENHISFIDNIDLRNFSEDSLVEASKAKMYDTVIFDTHPPQEQKLWPRHCVQESQGAQLHKDLELPNDAVPVYKGSNPDIDSYSAFWDNNKLSQTELYNKLKDSGITQVFVTGLATDFCVGYTTVDSLEFNFKTFLVDDAARGVDDHGIKTMKDKIVNLGGLIIDSSEVPHLVNGKDRRPELGLFSAKSYRKYQ